MSLIKCPECGATISSKADMCIHCGYPLRQKKKKNKIKEQYIQAENTNSQNAAVGFLHFYSFIIFVGGLIIAVVLSIETTGYGRKSMNWSSFLIYFACIACVGALYMCLAKVCENLQQIANAVQSYIITDKDGLVRYTSNNDNDNEESLDEGIDPQDLVSQEELNDENADVIIAQYNNPI